MHLEVLKFIYYFSFYFGIYYREPGYSLSFIVFISATYYFGARISSQPLETEHKHEASVIYV